MGHELRCLIACGRIFLMDEKEAIGRAVRQSREDKKLSRHELAQNSGLATGRIERIENGARLGIEEVETLLPALGLDPPSFRILWKNILVRAGEASSPPPIPPTFPLDEPSTGGGENRRGYGGGTIGERTLLDSGGSYSASPHGGPCLADLDRVHAYFSQAKPRDEFSLLHGGRQIFCQVLSIRR